MDAYADDDADDYADDYADDDDSSNLGCILCRRAEQLVTCCCW